MLSAQQIADSPQTAPRAPSRLIAFDIPFVKDQRTVRLDRIQTINAGSAIAPWSEDLSYDWPVPRFHGAGRDVRADVQGGVFRALESNKTRDIRFVDGTLEGNLSWFVAGMNGFFSREEIPEALSGRHFAATFTRRGYGLRAWGGFKMGEFARTFVTVKAGRGYVEAKGENRFDASVDGLDPTLLYYERFDSTVAVVDG